MESLEIIKIAGQSLGLILYAGHFFVSIWHSFKGRRDAATENMVYAIMFYLMVKI